MSSFILLALLIVEYKKIGNYFFGGPCALSKLFDPNEVDINAKVGSMTPKTGLVFA